MSEQSLRQQHADFLSTLQLAHFSLMQFVANIEPLQQDRSVTLSGISVFFADNAFQLSELHSVFIRKLSLRMNAVALFHRSPQTLVAHHHGVDNAIGVEGKLILAQYAELLWTHDSSLLRIKFAGQKVHKRSFTCAVRPGQAIALARRERRRDLFKQNFGAVAHGYIGN